MRWLDRPLALALERAKWHVDHPEVLIGRTVSNYWIDIT
jgi:hypothetical protein